MHKNIGTSQKEHQRHTHQRNRDRTQPHTKTKGEKNSHKIKQREKNCHNRMSKHLVRHQYARSTTHPHPSIHQSHKLAS